MAKATVIIVDEKHGSFQPANDSETTVTIVDEKGGEKKWDGESPIDLAKVGGVTLAVGGGVATYFLTRRDGSGGSPPVETSGPEHVMTKAGEKAILLPKGAEDPKINDTALKTIGTFAGGEKLAVGPMVEGQNKIAYKLDDKDVEISKKQWSAKVVASKGTATSMEKLDVVVQFKGSAPKGKYQLVATNATPEIQTFDKLTEGPEVLVKEVVTGTTGVATIRLVPPIQ